MTELGGIDDLFRHQVDSDEDDMRKRAAIGERSGARREKTRETTAIEEDNTASDDDAYVREPSGDDDESNGTSSSSDSDAEEQRCASEDDLDAQTSDILESSSSEGDALLHDDDIDLMESTDGEEDDDEQRKASESTDERRPGEETETKKPNDGKDREFPVAKPHHGTYVPPAVRHARMAAAAASAPAKSASDAHRSADIEEQRLVRRIRGLLNRLAETNLQGIVAELAALYESEGRSSVGKIVANELLASVAEGPRATERFAAATAACIAGLASSVRASDVIAVFLDALGARLEEAIRSEESLSCENLILVLAQLHLVSALKADILFSLLDHLGNRFGDRDVTAIASLLRTAGIALRGADPVRMKEFVVAIHERAGKESQERNGTLSVRARVMLDLVVDIKNNKRRGDSGSSQGSGPAAVLSPAIGKWLRSLDVSAVAMGGIPWQRIVSKRKKGIWWEPNAADAVASVAQAAKGLDEWTKPGPAISKALQGIESTDDGVNAPELLRLASAMRMNTDARRAVFCAVMGSEDAIDATEKLLRLGLKGEQEREIVRVTVECSLREASWNPYYVFLLTRLCKASKMHRMTLQFCLWDRWKEIDGIEDVRRLTRLARLTGSLLGGNALSPSVLKVVDFGSLQDAKEVLFWRVALEFTLESPKTEADVTRIFERVAVRPQLKSLQSKLKAFLRRSVGPWIANKDPKDPAYGGPERLEKLLRRCQVAELGLQSMSSRR